MFPLRDYNPTHRKIVIVPLLIALNGFVFLFVQPTFGSNVEQVRFVVCKATIPYEASHLERLADAPRASLDRQGDAIGAFQRENCPQKSVLLSILTSMFLHAGWLHIGGNMLYLWVFGNNIEDLLGPVRFLLFYVASGIVATYAQVLGDPSSTVPLIGASGAVAGVLGAYILRFPRARIRTLIFFFFITVADISAVVVLGVWFLLQLFQGVGSTTQAGGVAYLAHIGGFVAGLAMMAATLRRRHLPRGYA